MTDDRRFPVQRVYSIPAAERATLPTSLPWHLVEQWREQIEMNHGQTLERLCERGGLSPRELYLGANRLSLRMIRSIDERSAGRWLMSAVAAGGRPRPPDPLEAALADGAVLLDGLVADHRSTPITARFDSDGIMLQEWYWFPGEGRWIVEREVNLPASALDKLIAARSRSNAT